jgi:two-component system, sensor histidine kinase and response regulator
LPGLGGIALGRTIRADAKISGTIVIGASPDPDADRTTLLEQEFNAVLQTPLSPADLQAAIQPGTTQGVQQPVAPTSVPLPMATATQTQPHFEQSAPKKPPSFQPPKRAVRILLAEDNAVNQKIALRLLEKSGLSADLAKNGKEAVHASQSSRYDLILMDCQMPEMDGYEATAEIRKLERAMAQAPTPIVALTANAMAGDRERCLDCGMDDYMSKPFDVKALQGMISRWLDKET